MTIVVGFGPDVQSVGGLRLAGQLARARNADIVLCCVMHDAFDAPGLRDAHDVDAEWRRHLTDMAEDAIARAKAELPDDVRAETVVRTGRSVPQALRAEGEARNAEVLVVGSASLGSPGRIALGSTTDRLLHDSRIPVALAPRGYPGGEPLRRIVFAMEPTRGDLAIADRVADLARALNAEVQVVTFLVRQLSAAGALVESGVLKAWTGAVRDAHQTVASTLTAAGVSVVGSSIAEGTRWSGAVDSVDWGAGDLMVVGSSTHGPIASVFLGSTATRILRHSPVPVTVLPR